MENTIANIKPPGRWMAFLKSMALVWTITCAQAALEIGSVTLAWDPNTESDVSGYRIYYGSPAHTFTQVIDVGDVTTATVNGLLVGQVYSFHATCYNLAGLESGPSNSVDYMVPSTVPENQPPVAHALSLVTAQNIPLDFKLTGSDPDGDTFTFHLATEPAHGTLAGSAPNLTYTPYTDFVGLDSFAFFVHDGVVASDAATVSIIVEGVDDPVHPESQPRIIRTAILAEGVAITWTSVEGASYQVFYKDTLLDDAWIVLTDLMVATGPETTHIDPTTVPTVPGRYYAVARVEP
jgi:hypothetical protein